MSFIKFTLKSEIVPLSLLALTGLASIYFYNHFPEQVPIHWNIYGEVDGWGSRAMGAFSIPTLSLFIYLLFLLIPYLDPKKDRYEQFGKTYHIFKGILVSFMVLLYFMVGLNGIGYEIPIGTVIPIMIGVLFVVIGNYLSKIKPNWFMGIRTPWTLSSEENWNKTHRVSGKIFIIGGFLMMGMPLYPPLLKIIMLVMIVLALAFGTMGYSLYLYLSDKKNGKNNQPGQ